MWHYDYFKNNLDARESFWDNDSFREFFITEALRIKALNDDDYILQIRQLYSILMKMNELEELKKEEGCE